MRKRLLALALTAALLLPCGALAAPGVSARQADLDALYETLKTGHPDLFSVTPESDFLARKAALEAALGEGDDFTFAMELQSLAALAGDSHTALSFSAAGGDLHYLPAVPDYLEGRWVLSQARETDRDYLGWEVTEVNGLTMDQVTQRFRTLASADNDVRLRRQVRQMFYVSEILCYLGVAQAGAPVTLTLRGPEGTQALALTPVTSDGLAGMVSLKSLRPAAPATEFDKAQAYFSLPLDEATYYIQYNRCQEDPASPMADFAAKVAADLASGAYTQVLLDLRNNGGGSDGVIAPLLEVLAGRVRAGDLRLYGLVGEATYSSAVINAVMVWEIGGYLAGGPSGGSVDHFGAVRTFTLPSGLQGGCSTKWIDMETLLASAAGLGVAPITPDFAADQTLADLLAGKDTLVEALLSRGAAWTPPARPALTRAAFVEDLWRVAGCPAAGTGHPFTDVFFPIASYVPALDWAAEAGLVLGDGQGAFCPTAAITAEEQALIQSRLGQ